jgi:hydroxypyruvate reductase
MSLPDSDNWRAAIMPRSKADLRADAERIWWAGVAAVAPSRLVPQCVRVDGDILQVGDDAIDLRGDGRIAVVGGGKAAGAMAVALELALGPGVLAEKQVTGWVNVPADCVVPTARIHLHPGRPAGINEPRPEGVHGTRKILELVESLGPNDLCFCLLSGGASALLAAPLPGVALEDKIRLTQRLTAAGADIQQLNTVRSQLSAVKAGGLARACRAGRLVTLIISDVPGDPLEVIASGPTVEGTATPDDALDVLQQLKMIDAPDVEAVVAFLRRQSTAVRAALASTRTTRVTNVVIGNNAVAVDAAGLEAERLGYSHAMISSTRLEGPAEEVGRHMALVARRMRREPGPDCLISGGEPTVSLVDQSIRGQGGRNQQLALAALAELGDCGGIALLAGGTDGEDGPTDAAGAVVTAAVVAAARRQQLDAADSLRRNDAYTFFAAAGGLFQTGPTQTNVGDLRVVVVARYE